MSTIATTNIKEPSSATNNITLTSGGDTQINGALGLGGATYGTSGQVLTSAGSGSTPTWETLSTGAGTVQAWIAFNGGSASIGTGDGSSNVDGVTDNGTGDYTVNFTSNLSSANYCVSIDMANTTDFTSSLQNAARGGPDCCVHGTTRPTASAVRVTSFAGSSANNDGVAINAYLYVACIL